MFGSQHSVKGLQCDCEHMLWVWSARFEWLLSLLRPARVCHFSCWSYSILTGTVKTITSFFTSCPKGKDTEVQANWVNSSQLRSMESQSPPCREIVSLIHCDLRAQHPGAAKKPSHLIPPGPKAGSHGLCPVGGDQCEGDRHPRSSGTPHARNKPCNALLQRHRCLSVHRSTERKCHLSRKAKSVPSGATSCRGPWKPHTAHKEGVFCPSDMGPVLPGLTQAPDPNVCMVDKCVLQPCSVWPSRGKWLDPSALDLDQGQHWEVGCATGGNTASVPRENLTWEWSLPTLPLRPSELNRLLAAKAGFPVIADTHFLAFSMFKFTPDRYGQPSCMYMWQVRTLQCSQCLLLCCPYTAAWKYFTQLNSSLPLST